MCVNNSQDFLRVSGISPRVLLDLYEWLSCSIIYQTTLSVDLDSKGDYDDNINYLLLNVLLDIQTVYQSLGISNKDLKHLIDGLFYNNKTSMT